MIELFQRQAKSGSFGDYYKLSARRGVKVLRGYLTARREFRKLRKVGRLCPGLFPKAFGVVKTSRGFGVLITHVAGKQPARFDSWRPLNAPTAIAKAYRRLLNAGVRWRDCARRNTIITAADRARFVDAGHLQFLRKK